MKETATRSPALVLALCLSSAAFGGSGLPGTLEPDFPFGLQSSASRDGSPTPLAEDPEAIPTRGLNEGLVRTLQSGAGLVGGALLGVSGAALGVSAVDCSSDPGEENFGCGIAKGISGVMGASAGYIIGTSLGVYLAGRGLHREGSFWAGFAGAVAGFAAGALVANQMNLETTPMVIVIMGASNLFSVGTYAWSDRVQTRFSFAPEPGSPVHASADLLEAGSMRTEVRLVLWRP